MVVFLARGRCLKGTDCRCPGEKVSGHRRPAQSPTVEGLACVRVERKIKVSDVESREWHVCRTCVRDAHHLLINCCIRAQVAAAEMEIGAARETFTPAFVLVYFFIYAKCLADWQFQFESLLTTQRVHVFRWQQSGIKFVVEFSWLNQRHPITDVLVISSSNVSENGRFTTSIYSVSRTQSAGRYVTVSFRIFEDLEKYTFLETLRPTEPEKQCLHFFSEHHR